jgi:hypothetical protein
MCFIYKCNGLNTWSVFSLLSLIHKETEALAITVRDVWAPNYGSRQKDAGRRDARPTIRPPHIICLHVCKDKVIILAYN